MSPEHGWVEFDALIELMPWGRNVYTIVRLQAGKVRAVPGARYRHR